MSTDNTAHDAQTPLYEVAQDRTDNSSWRVEAIDYANDGAVRTTLFMGPEARERAEAYAAFKNAPASAHPEQGVDLRQVIGMIESALVGRRLPTDYITAPPLSPEEATAIVSILRSRLSPGGATDEACSACADGCHDICGRSCGCDCEGRFVGRSVSVTPDARRRCHAPDATTCAICGLRVLASGGGVPADLTNDDRRDNPTSDLVGKYVHVTSNGVTSGHWFRGFHTSEENGSPQLWADVIDHGVCGIQRLIAIESVDCVKPAASPHTEETPHGREG